MNKNIRATGIPGQISIEANGLGLIFFAASNLKAVKVKGDDLKVELADGRHYFVTGTFDDIQAAIAESSRGLR